METGGFGVAGTLASMALKSTATVAATTEETGWVAVGISTGISTGLRFKDSVIL